MCALIDPATSSNRLGARLQPRCHRVLDIHLPPTSAFGLLGSPGILTCRPAAPTVPPATLARHTAVKIATLQCPLVPTNAQAFHEKWSCSGSPACKIWANSDAFEQGAFAVHMLGSPTWRPFITMADARTHNAPCLSFDEAQQRGALACHFLAEYKDSIPKYIETRLAAAMNHS